MSGKRSSGRWERPARETNVEREFDTNLGEARFVRGTSGAVCVWLPTHQRELWLPRGHIHPDSGVLSGEDVTQLFVTDWIAQEKEL